jgi:hypothetical protein
MNSTDYANPQGFNLYAYCSNDPVNRIDPDGLGLISALKRAFKKVIRAFVHAVIAGLIAFVMSGFNLGAGIAVFAADFAAQLGIQNQGYWYTRGTPPTFPVGGVTLSQIFHGTILASLFPSPQDLMKFVIPINGFMPMGAIGPCTFNINIYGAKGDLLTAIQNEITRIFQSGGILNNVVFGHPERANGGSANLYIVDAYRGEAADHLGRQGRIRGSVPGVTPTMGNNSYVNQSVVAGARGRSFGPTASLGTMLGRVGAHEVIQHRFLGIGAEGIDGRSLYGGINHSDISFGIASSAELSAGFTTRFNVGISTSGLLNGLCR